MTDRNYKYWRHEDWKQIKLDIYDKYKPLSGNITLAEANDNLFEAGADAMYQSVFSKAPTTERLEAMLEGLLIRAHDEGENKLLCDTKILAEMAVEKFQSYALSQQVQARKEGQLDAYIDVQTDLMSITCKDNCEAMHNRTKQALEKIRDIIIASRQALQKEEGK